jgi:hypothetical protein
MNCETPNTHENFDLAGTFNVKDSYYNSNETGIILTPPPTLYFC